MSETTTEKKPRSASRLPGYNHHAPPGACLRLYRYACPAGHAWHSTGDAEYCPSCESKELARQPAGQEEIDRVLNGNGRTNEHAKRGAAKRLAAKRGRD